jgi:hypothetical protein
MEREMRPFVIRLIIASLLFSLIVTATVTWVVSQIPQNPELPPMNASLDIPSPKAALDPTVYPVSFCELIQHPDRFDRKLVQTRAIFVNDVDWAFIKDAACENEDAMIEYIGAREPNDKLIEAQRPDKIGAILKTYLREGKELPEVNIEFVGRFYAEGKNRHRVAILREIEAKPAARKR